MSGLVFLIPIALLMGLTGLLAFIWAVRSGQFDDPEGAAVRILISSDEPLLDTQPATKAGRASFPD
ncbi:MAG: cbb3-type cytochrome oxidase assembly protein CcoS [Hyphomonas sp.]|uniref:cbb3-type cytochrome oxidase assembly protein CcoS n=1 Tax=Hyphomonas sp. TaxID=87 RepID=UPI001809D154|nr:cbb3-type cytochrome oxidase assembly protein CcoS [Hyphomonas sp.]MBA3070139.1 cbb3-type cytochrome oxidase assembly protein CcoS [Hyphomonas sp.]MBU3922339.1 cbb3-type cytochrome oxidase assembly protein CcoS [Alphaproteobacteria bacterium]MBU4060285.1 cbb3-type cytochrome oxidase assembly protein CcoS [Alphaproteobacteria bacterium]MBU4162953.1 cbb3-type cytochrome oxidase assembly protein CcoS [Alphaproteobacteria bacterium]